MTEQWIDHYDRLATKYDLYNGQYHEAILRCVPECLTFEKDDVVVDIGGGTGEIAHKLWKQAELKNPILSADPAKNMVMLANTREGVTGIHAGAEEFFGSELSSGKLYDKILMNGCAHLFSDPKAVFTGVKECLSDNGVCFVLDLHNMTPLFRSLEEKFEAEGGYLTWEPLYEIFETLGLKYKTLTSVQKVPVPKSQWYAGMRDRCLTKLETFTDEEIEKGILEMEKEYGDQDVLEIVVTLKVALVTK